MDYGITPGGFVKKPYSVILEEILTNYETVFPGFRRHESNVLYLQAQATANREEQLWNVLEAVYYSRYVITTSGSALTMRVIDVIGKRLDPGFASGYVMIVADPGTIIPQGTLVKRINSDIQYRILYQYIVEDSKPVKATVQCTTAGLVGNIAKGNIEGLVETITGVQSVYNEDPIIGGTEEENDDELKERYYASLQDSRGSNIPAISARLRSLGLYTYSLRENRSKNEQEVNGVRLPPHSIAVTVIGGVDEEIAEALFHTKAGGIDMLGSTEVPVKDEDGTTYKVLFTRGSGTTLYVKLTVRVNFQFLNTHETTLRAQIADYINHLAIDEKLDYELLIAKAFDGIPGVLGFDLYVGKTDPPTEQTDIVPSTNEKFIVLDDSVNIIVQRG